MRIEGLLPAGTFETFVDPGVPLPPVIAGLTGLADRDLRSAPQVDSAVRRFLAFAGDAVLVAHNARFDLAFLDRAVERLTERRIAAPVVDTAGLARRLLAGRAVSGVLSLMPTSFGELRVSDGRVTGIVIRAGVVLVHLQDWQKRAVAVTFEEVVGFDGLGAIDVDLSHAGESADDPMIQRARARSTLETRARSGPRASGTGSAGTKRATSRAATSGPRAKTMSVIRHDRRSPRTPPRARPSRSPSPGPENDTACPRASFSGGVTAAMMARSLENSEA